MSKSILPKDWVVKPLGEVCLTGAGGTPLKAHKDYYENGDIPWLLSGEVSQGNIYKAKKFITEKGLRNSSAKLFPPNTILIAMYGATAGEVGILKFEACTNQAICGILPNNKTIPKYLFYCFLSKKDELISQAVGGAQPNISQIKIKNTKIPVPPLATQQKIVTVLDKTFKQIDKAITNTKQNLQNTQDLFNSSLEQVFNNPDDDWITTTLNKLSDNLDSRRHPITKKYRKKGVVPYYGASGVVDYVEGHLFNENLLCISEDGANLLDRNYPIAFSISGKTWVNNHAHVLRFDNMASQKCVELYINLIRIDDFISGMAQPKLNQKMLNRIPIPIPPLATQQKIVKKLDTLSTQTQALKQSYTQKLESLQTLKKSLLEKAFNGELV